MGKDIIYIRVYTPYRKTVDGKPSEATGSFQNSLWDLRLFPANFWDESCCKGPSGKGRARGPFQRLSPCTRSHVQRLFPAQEILFKVPPFNEVFWTRSPFQSASLQRGPFQKLFLKSRELFPKDHSRTVYGICSFSLYMGGLPLYKGFFFCSCLVSAGFSASLLTPFATRKRATSKGKKLALGSHYQLPRRRRGKTIISPAPARVTEKKPVYGNKPVRWKITALSLTLRSEIHASNTYICIYTYV